jgi:hypothetical protein
MCFYILKPLHDYLLSMLQKMFSFMYTIKLSFILLSIEVCLHYCFKNIKIKWGLHDVGSWKPTKISFFFFLN